MLKIKSRIALLYSLLTIFFIITCAVSFYGILKIYIRERPVIQSVTGSIVSKAKKTNSIGNEKSIVKNKNGFTSYASKQKKFEYKSSENGTIQKNEIQIDGNDKNGKICAVYDDGSSIDIGIIKNNKPPEYTQNNVLTVFDGNNKVILSNILPNDFSESDVSKNYGTKDLKIYSQNKISLKDILSKHTSGKLLVVSDKNDNVIRSQLVSDKYIGLLDGASSNNVMKITSSQLEIDIMHVLYERSFYIIIAIIIFVVIINFILSKKYAVFALKPLIEFTAKVKGQSEFKSIKLIEMPEVKDEIYDLTFAYNSALGKVKKSYEDLQRLNSYASHELRNSLAVLRAKLEIGEDTKEITAYIDRITGVTNDILAMTTPKLTNNEEQVDIALICAKVVDDYIEIFNNINLQLPEEGVNLIKGKEIWIERCIVNLVDNAIKFADKSKEKSEINVGVLENGNEVIIEIYDNGIGIDKEKINEIFKPYYGGNSRVSTGIGLAYVKHVMDLHMGKVLVESNKGQYSKFSLVFNE